MKKKKTKTKLKKNVVFVSLIIFILIIALVLGIIYINSKKLTVKYSDKIEVNINQEIFNLDNIKEVKNGKISTKKEKIDTKTIGKKEVTIEIEDHFKKIKKITYTVNVKDKESPKINFNKSLETEVGTKIDLLKDVTVTDNSSELISATIEGEYSFDKVGEYKLFYIAKDSSMNETKEEFTLKVKEKKEEPKVNTNGTTSTNNNTSSNTNNNTAKTTSFTTSKGFKGVTQNGITYIDGYIIVNKTYTLPSNYGSGLTKETTDNFNIMKNQAASEGLNIYISSGFRSYNRQKTIYNNYVQRDGQKNADTYSARAGHSEHQSGLAFDVNTINTSFANTNEGKWLAANCYKYGFILRYPKGKTNETGYMYEPWHFRYVGKSLAEKLYNNGDWITMENYFGITSEYQN